MRMSSSVRRGAHGGVAERWYSRREPIRPDEVCPFDDVVKTRCVTSSRLTQIAWSHAMRSLADPLMRASDSCWPAVPYVGRRTPRHAARSSRSCGIQTICWRYYWTRTLTSSPLRDEPGQMTVAAGRMDSSPKSWPRLGPDACNMAQRDRDRGPEGHFWDTPSPVHES